MFDEINKIVSHFHEHHSNDDFLEFLFSLERNTRDTINILRVFYNCSACEAYIKILPNDTFLNKFKKEFDNDKKNRNRWIREFLSCPDDDIRVIVRNNYVYD